MVSSTNPADNLTVHNTASDPYSLKAMTVRGGKLSALPRKPSGLPPHHTIVLGTFTRPG